MEKIKSFDKQSCKALRVEIDSALKTVADKYGISLSIGNISFNSESFRTRLEAKTSGAVEKKPAVIDYSEMLGYPAIGTEFKMQGKTFRVTNHKPERPKYPIIGTDVLTGKQYKFTVDMVKNPFNGIGMK